jgi:hypothetical protein
MLLAGERNTIAQRMTRQKSLLAAPAPRGRHARKGRRDAAWLAAQSYPIGPLAAKHGRCRQRAHVYDSPRAATAVPFSLSRHPCGVMLSADFRSRR